MRELKVRIRVRYQGARRLKSEIRPENPEGKICPGAAGTAAVRRVRGPGPAPVPAAVQEAHPMADLHRSQSMLI